MPTKLVKVVQEDAPTALKRKSYLPEVDTASHEADAELKPILEMLIFVVRGIEITLIETVSETVVQPFSVTST